jgi:hypothetical protein
VRTVPKQHKSGGSRKIGRAKAKCERYRTRIGKPNGRGMSGNKAGKNAGRR